VRDIHHRGLDSPALPEFYLPIMQASDLFWTWIDRSLNVVVRTTGDPLASLEAVRAVIRSIDADVPIHDVTTLDAVIAGSVADTRSLTGLLLGVALLALLLAAIGIYGVMSFIVRQRTQEIGIRMALGARRNDVRRIVLRRSLLLTGIGLALGIPAALLLTRFIRSSLFETAATDPLTFGGVLVVLGVTAMVASGVPAWGATRVDPLRALRSE
jgi:putative ABC transport system permease protein